MNNIDQSNQYTSHFDAELTSSFSASQRPSDVKKRLGTAAVGVFAIAAVACIALLFVNGGAPTSDFESSNPLSIQQTQTETAKGLRGFTDLHEHATTLLEFHRSFGITSKKLLNIATGIAKGDATQIQRIGTLVLTYSFDLIDSNDNQTVEKAEWDAFVKALFPSDVSTYSPLFAEVNNGQPFTFAQFVQYISKKAQSSSDLSKLRPSTDKKVTEIALAKLVLNDDRNYALTYKLVFQIFDENNDSTLTQQEVIDILVVFGQPQSKAKTDSEKVFAFAKQSALSDDGKTITFTKFSQFAAQIRKPLQQKLAAASTLLQLHIAKNELLVTKLSIHAQPVLQLAYTHAFMEVEKQTASGNSLTAEQKKVLTHFFQTITQYEFSLLDTDNNKAVSQKEFRAAIDQIFKNDDDRKHYYANFDAVNAGKDVTLAQFQQQIVQKVQNPSQAYQPKENQKLIGKRAALFIVNNKQNYALTYNFVFNLFDINSDKVVSVSEIHNTFALFVQNKSDLDSLDTSVQQAFTQLKSAQVGDGSKITIAEWTAFANKIQPQLLQAIQNTQTMFLTFLQI